MVRSQSPPAVPKPIQSFGMGTPLDHLGLPVPVTPGAEFRYPEVGDDSQVVLNLGGFTGKGHREQGKHSLCSCPAPGGFQTIK